MKKIYPSTPIPKVGTNGSDNYKLRSQRGYSVPQLVVWIAIVTLVVIFSIPNIKGLLIEFRLPEVSGEMQRLMSRLRVMGETGVAQPFANVNNENNLIAALRGSSVVLVNEANNTVAHKLGGRGAGTNGTVILAPAQFESYGLGSAYQLTFSNVHDKVCPTLATMLSSASERITINGSVVKDNREASMDSSYNAIDAQTHCTDGEVNTFVFVAR